MKKTMSDNNEVKNINEDGLTEGQKVLMGKAKEIQAILEKEPQAQITPFLRVTEAGIRPDARLTLVKKSDEQEDTEPADEGVDGGDNQGDEEGSSGEQPTEASN